MAPIPLTVQSLLLSNTTEGKSFRRTLVALLLRNENEEGEPEVILTQTELRSAEDYTLRCTVIQDEDAIVLTAIRRK